jgi:hypothetical protein
LCYFLAFSNITHCKWRESQFFMFPLPPTLFYLAQFGLFVLSFCFRQKLSTQLFRNPCDSSISPIYYSTRKTSFGAAYSFPMINLTLSSQQDVIFHQVNREIQYFSVVLSTLTNMRRVANLLPSYSIQTHSQDHLIREAMCHHTFRLEIF